MYIQGCVFFFFCSHILLYKTHTVQGKTLVERVLQDCLVYSTLHLNKKKQFLDIFFSYIHLINYSWNLIFSDKNFHRNKTFPFFFIVF